MSLYHLIHDFISFTFVRPLRRPGPSAIPLSLSGEIFLQKFSALMALSPAAGIRRNPFSTMSAVRGIRTDYPIDRPVDYV